MKNKQSMISQKPPDKEVIFKLVIHFKQFTLIQYLQTAIQLLKESSKRFRYSFQFQNMCPP